MLAQVTTFTGIVGQLVDRGAVECSHPALDELRDYFKGQNLPATCVAIAAPTGAPIIPDDVLEIFVAKALSANVSVGNAVLSEVGGVDAAHVVRVSKDWGIDRLWLEVSVSLHGFNNIRKLECQIESLQNPGSQSLGRRPAWCIAIRRQAKRKNSDRATIHRILEA